MPKVPPACPEEAQLPQCIRRLTPIQATQDGPGKLGGPLGVQQLEAPVQCGDGSIHGAPMQVHLLEGLAGIREEPCFESNTRHLGPRSSPSGISSNFIRSIEVYNSKYNCKYFNRES